MRRRTRAAAAGLLVLLVASPPAGAGRAPTVAASPPVDVDSVRLEPLAPESFLRVQGVGEFRGALELRRSRLQPAAAPGTPPPPATTGVGVVNEVGFEDYLKGIAEMPSGWPAEALRAQAIAARTYALWVLESGSAGAAEDLGAQICATEGCQVYAGLAKERAPGGGNWVSAVEATAGRVLLHGGKPIVAKYSSSNGGRSVSGGRPYLQPVDDPDDARSPLHRWTLTVSFDDIGRALAAPGAITAVRREGGSVVVDWTAPDGVTGQTVAPATEFRSKLNAAVPPPPGRSRTVPSIRFELAADPAARVASVAGRGYGHGIGMSQYGAYGKALRGLSADAILAAYYGGVRPTTPPAGRLPATVRVAVDHGRSEVRAGASGLFRVLDGAGNVLASVATGSWRVTPGPRGGLRLHPPAGHSGPAAVELVAVEPVTGAIGQPMVVRFRSRVPALVRAVATPPGGEELEVLSLTPILTEEASLTLPPPSFGGAYIVRFTADAGGGRTAELVLPPRVHGPPPPPPEEPPMGRLARMSRSVMEAMPPLRAAPERASEPGPLSGGLDLGAGIGSAVVLAGAAGRWWLRRQGSSAAPSGRALAEPASGPGLVNSRPEEEAGAASRGR